ncbi:hypothetical protein AVR82_17345 (plasmid) [Lactiplantibacillus plantarum]|nr:hypothetical protein AVR82_17345 [Lactiplantibacillus plantarum]AOB24711.1 hypothetical protein AVR83_17335 [Lactiplantibacillus plantarum]AOB24748.1 hypothetical protein AVR83_17550 [Lactiplantibacillus plantarum]
MARQSDNFSCRRIYGELHRNPSMISHELKHETVCQIGTNHKPFETYFSMIHANHRTARNAVIWVLAP